MFPFRQILFDRSLDRFSGDTFRIEVAVCVIDLIGIPPPIDLEPLVRHRLALAARHCGDAPGGADEGAQARNHALEAYRVKPGFRRALPQQPVPLKERWRPGWMPVV